MIFYSASDHHFFHQNIIKYCNRSQPTWEQDAIEMIKRHNEVVGPNDVVFLLGDLTASLKGREEQLGKIISKLNGYKIMTLGNHDHLSKERYEQLGIDYVCDHFVIGNKFFNHYQLTGKEKEYYNLPDNMKAFEESGCDTIYHGHIHQRDSDQSDGIKRINCCIDYNHRPIEICTGLDDDYNDFIAFVEYTKIRKQF